MRIKQSETIIQKKATKREALNGKVKFILEKAMKAQRGSRGIALLFL
jgi:hypothetical protein